MDRQAVLDVLNSLEVIEENGGEDAYLLVENNEENRAKLNAVGITDETISRYCGPTDELFCIASLAAAEGYADEYDGNKLIAWGPIDDALRNRVLSFQGTASDAYRLFKELYEPEIHEVIREEITE